jgi:SAM-dependent methyltransferase
MNTAKDWWDGFFDGPAVELWLQAVSRDQTEQEAGRLETLLALAPGAEVLDVPCGGGRIALSLAARGFRTTGVDWSPEFLDHARATDGGRRVTWERRDMRDLPWRARFDGAVCVGNSFGYLDDGGNAQFLRSVRAALKTGGRFVLDTPMVLENVIAHVRERPWWQVGDFHLLAENRYDAVSGRLEIEYTFVNNGRVVKRRGSHRAYALRELIALLESAGFSVELAEPWTIGTHSVTLIATAT